MQAGIREATADAIAGAASADDRIAADRFITDFHRELARVNRMLGILATMGGDVSEPAAEVTRITRRGTELLGSHLGEQR